MRFARSRQQSGIALIIVLLVITVLAILAGGFAYSMKVETKLARNSNHDPELEWIGRSGVEAAKYVLSLEAQGPGGQLDYLNSVWAGGTGLDTNNMAAQFPLDNYELAPGRSFSVKITDLDRKFNINMANQDILRQALMLVGVDPSAQSVIIDSVLDWRDPNDDAGTSGAESSHYQALNPPYFAKNGPIDDISELLRINGVTPAMFWGSSPQGMVSRIPQAMRSRFDEPTYAVGLRDLFTALSSRAMNVNTASAIQLQILPPIDENVAQAIISRRAGPDGAEGTTDDTPFRNPGEISSIAGLPPPVFQQIGPYLTTRSMIFEARITAKVDTQTRDYIAILRRNSPRDIQLLSLYWE